jgi:hypothetical protein
MTTIAAYGEKKAAIFNAALEAIANGGIFNGTVYCKNRNKNNTNISIYVSNEHFCLGDVWPIDADKIKEEFLSAVAQTNKKEKLPAGRFGQGNYEYGTENWLYSGMNGE